MYPLSYAPPHAHHFRTVTFVTLRHAHELELFTYPSNGNRMDNHYHSFAGATSTQAKHFHRVEGNTGPAVALPNGGHYHLIHSEVNDEPFEFMEGYYTTVLSIPRHTHLYIGATSEGLGYFPSKWR